MYSCIWCKFELLSLLKFAANLSTGTAIYWNEE